MKISINWAFDHIDCDVRSVDIPELIKKFNKTTAETESYTQISYKTDQWFLVHINKISADTIVGINLALNISYTLSFRPDVAISDWVIIKVENNQPVWLSLMDLGSSKEGLVAPIAAPAIPHDTEVNSNAGLKIWMTQGWKQELEKDYIIEIDNKSITHRPDLWGHRGIAREMAAILGYALKPISHVLTFPSDSTWSIPVEHKAFQGTLNTNFTISIEDKVLCKRFAAMKLDSLKNQNSMLFIAQRLARIDSRAINMLVDFTNYVMYDLGQPMHAFDIHKLRGTEISVRTARDKESLTLLDGTTVSLVNQDLVVADTKGPIALAGVMGGRDTSISRNSTSILIESAWFDATAIRKTAMRYKKRTEASTRFEKNLDPFQNEIALKRFLWLLNLRTAYKPSFKMLSLGIEEIPHILEIEHHFIETRLGVSIAQEFVLKTLTSLECLVEIKVYNQKTMYKIIVPSFRASKDLLYKEDIVEEIGRFFGYDKIPVQLPSIISKPKNLQPITWVHDVKRYCAYAGRMHELYNYALYDESWLAELGWEPQRDAVQIKNPLSENWRRLVTSLMPHLIKAVYQNKLENDQLRFFEWARIWHLENNEIKERKSVAGIFYEAQKEVDFYEIKSFIEQLYISRGCNLEWQQMTEIVAPWYSAHKSAFLLFQGNIVGYAGMMNQQFTAHLLPGNAFIYELDGEFLQLFTEPAVQLTPLSKYPEVRRDISIIIPAQVTVAQISRIIKETDSRIVQVILIDRFEKKDWENAKSLTFRFVLRDMNKTMTTDEVDTIWNSIALKLKQLGATVR